ncbi:MAG: hypothetical protein COB15_12645 [Flavobacteriales bacterium]|nr:MAG: hypothetical protein COB15_12645 [Flavobacteriales bacterium]
MKSYISIAFSVLISLTTFAQNQGGSSGNTVTKISGKVIPNYKTQTNYVENKTDMVSTSQLAGSYQITPFLPKKKTSNTTSLQNIGYPFNNSGITVAKTTVINQEATVTIDPRNLQLSPNGKLLSPDGYEIEFRTSGNPKVTNVCATPRPYIVKGASNKNAACSFTVPCDDPANRDAASTITKYFMLRWHVMLNGGTSTNIDQAMITAMMTTLNADYAAHNMIFCEDSAEWNEDVTNYFHDSNTEEVSLKTQYNQRPSELINIYVVGDMTAGGYARFPYDPMGGTNYRGGIVLNKGNCNAAGHTLAHEMGHTFGLEHTFAGVDERSQCSSCYERVRNVNGSSNTSGAATPFGGPYNTEGDQEGDWCSDTNPHDTYTYNCSTSSNPNGACDSGPWNNAPVNNHMSYSFCSTQFTNQQSSRSHCMVNSYLQSWTSYGGGICGTQPPVADFVGSPTTWQSPSTVTFTDLSQPNAIITSWSWDFNAAGQAGTVTPATYNSTTSPNPPPVVYDILGSATCLDYEVTLTVTSSNGNDTEVKTSYINVCPPSGDCDTLDFQWITPATTITTYGLSATDNMTGIPDAINLVNFTDAKGVYEGYQTPNLGVTTVGAVRVGLGSLVDADDDITFQVMVYDDDGNGQPGALLGGRGGISPTQLGVPGAGFYNEFWIPLFTPLTPTTGYFHVGVEMFAGDATDELVVMTTCDHTGPPACGPQGEADSSNNIFTSGSGYEKLMPAYGYDGDVDIIPMLGEYNPLPVVTGFTENVVCDTTYVTIFDTVYYHDYAGSALVGMSYTFASDGTVINTTSPLSSINRTYTTAGPEIVTITAINDCGRADTTSWIIPYNFMPTPDAEFTKVQPNPICMGAPGVDFNANTSGYQDYNWDFGDGTVASSGSNSTTNHVYAAPGLYYTTLTVTSTSYQAVDTFYLEDFEGGWPAGYQRFSNDPFAPNAALAGLGFVGGNATSWLPINFDGDGSSEATSASWHLNAGETADDWMLTTGIGALPANQMLTWDAEAYNVNFPDGYEVRISTTQLPANVANYSTLLYSTTAENSFRTTRSVSLAAYTGQTVFIAFVNNSTDRFLLGIDNIRVGTTGPGCIGEITKTDFVEIVDCSIIPPVADLNVTDSTGCDPLTITFTDNTLGVPDPVTSWLWNFGDGTFSTAPNPPAHVYNVGTYFASLETCNAGGCSTDFVTIIVGTGTAALAGNDQTLCGATTATLAGNDPAPDTGVWALLSGAGTVTTPTAFGSGVTGLATGTNQFTWTITGTGCTTVDTVEIIIVAPETAGGDDLTLTLCNTPGNTLDLNTVLAGNTIAGTWAETTVSGQFTVGTGIFDANGLIPGAYTFIYYVAGNTPCVNDTADFTVTVLAPESAGADDLTATLCNTGATLDLNTLLSGNTVAGTWAETTASGQFTPGTGIFDGNALVTGAYTFIYYVASTTPCANDTADFTVTITTAPTISNVLEICNVANTHYTVSFDVSGGTGGPYTVTENLPGAIGGAFVGTIWTSNLIPSGTAYDFDVDDANGCGPVNVSGVKVCICITDAGTMNLTALNLCETDMAIATHNGDHIFDPNDNIMYVLHTNNTATLGTVLDTNLIAPTFGFSSPPLTYGVTYYISAVVGDSLGVFVDPTDGCLQVSPGTPVTWEQSPAAGLNDSTTVICNTVGSTVDLNTLLSGNSAVGVWAEITASGQFTVATGIFDANGLTAATYAFTYIVSGISCPADTAYFGVTVSSQGSAGTGNTLLTCSTAGTTDLYTLLGVADLGGTWIGPSVLTGGDQGTFDPLTNTAGTYQYIISGTAPCADDTADVVITINPSASAGTNNTLSTCLSAGTTDLFTLLVGADPTGLWSPALASGTGVFNPAVDPAGTYQYIVTGTAPCPDDTAEVVVSVSSTPNAGTDTTVSMCVTTPPVDLFTLLVGADPTGIWTPALASGTGVFNPAVDPAGTYQYIVAGTPPCGSDTADVIVAVTTTDDPTFTYADFCAGSGGVAGTPTTPGGTFSFNPDPLDGSTIDSITGAITNEIGGSTYNIQYLTPAGVCQDSLTLSVNVDICVTSIFTTSSTTICAGDSIVFTDASTGGVTIWLWDFDSTSLGGAVPSSILGQGPHIVFYNTPGTYIVELTASNGSTTDITSVTITVNDCSPTANFSPSQTTFCKGNCITFNDLSLGTPTAYSWSFQGGIPATATGANPGSICYDTAGTYNVSLTVTNQYGADSIMMTSLLTVTDCDPPIAAITMNDADGEICVNNCIEFTYDDSLGGIPDSLYWTFEGGIDSTYESTNISDVINVCWNDTLGSFTVTVVATNAYGSSSKSQTILVHPNPTIYTGIDTTINIGMNGYVYATVIDTGGALVNTSLGVFDWTPTTYLTSPSSQNSTVIVPMETTTYTVTYTDEYGCVVSDNVIVNVDMVFNIGVPSAFAPNSSVNNILYVKGKIVIESLIFTIYNRYGQKVFESDDIDQGWDGKHNEKELNPGVFVYYVKVKFIDGSQGELKGNVTLIK